LDRFAPTGLRNPREERFTEAFAATLEAAPELAETLVERWSKRYRDGGNWDDLPAGKLGPLEVQTQRRADRLDRVDIELLFGPRANPALRVWLELKRDAPLGPGQLERYGKALRRLPGPAPRRSEGGESGAERTARADVLCLPSPSGPPQSLRFPLRERRRPDGRAAVCPWYQPWYQSERKSQDSGAGQ